MKKSFLVLMILAFTMILTGAIVVVTNQSKQEYQSEKKNNSKKTEVKSCCSSEMENEEANENSVYLLNEAWKTSNNKTINWANLKGTPRIMAMIFTNCTYACPVIVNDMKKVEAGLSKKDLDRVKFLLVTIDPERDTPEAMTNFAKNMNLDLNRWELLTSNENNVSELAAVLGFKYKQEKDKSFSHSNIITVLNSEGEIAHQHFGLNQNIEDVIEAVHKTK